MKFLFVKERLSYPRSSGHDVHSFYMMQALARLGHAVSLATVHAVDSLAIVGGQITSTHLLDDESTKKVPLQLSKMQEKFRNYWGIDPKRISQVGSLSQELQADVVVVVGLNVLPYLGAVTKAKRVWYAGDEWVWHHWSQVAWLRRSTWGEMKQALIKGMYERAYAPLLDRVWMVSDADRKAYRWVTGSSNVDVLPNGIDCQQYQPGNEKPIPYSCVFWGRLDFGPNIQALQWFCQKIWPKIRSTHTNALFRIYGFQPTVAVHQLVQPGNGIELIADLPDIRPEIRKHQVVVLPFVSGGGIKNKLLEAAAMGQAILCTPRTVKGLHPQEGVVQATSTKQWVQELTSLWQEETRRHKLGEAARRWVVKDHTWEAAAQKALTGLGMVSE